MKKHQVVYEDHHGFAEGVGPYGSRKVGLRIDDRVLWHDQIIMPNTREQGERFDNSVSELAYIIEAIEFYQKRQAKK